MESYDMKVIPLVAVKLSILYLIHDNDTSGYCGYIPYDVDHMLIICMSIPLNLDQLNYR